MRASFVPSRMRGWALSALCGAFCAGCPDNLERQSHVTKLRVLAVQAEPAELVLAQPLPSSVLTALAVEPSGAPISLRLALCTTQGALPSSTLACPGAQGIDLPDAGLLSARLDLGDPRVQALALELAAEADAGGVLPDGGSVQGLLAQGIPVLLGFEATALAGGNPDGGPPGVDGGPQELSGFTTITLRSDSRPLNHNPRLAAVQLRRSGQAAQELPAIGALQVGVGEKVRLIPVPAPDAKETTSAGLESLGYSFFVTDGSTSSLRSTDTTATGGEADSSIDWTAPPFATHVRLWVVVRDGRGGTGWLERHIDVR